MRTTEILEQCYNGDARRSLEVSIQDQISDTINTYFARTIQTLTIVTATEIDDKTILVSSASEPTNNNIICIQNNTFCYQGVILSHVATGGNWTLTLDSPLDHAFSTNSSIAEKSISLKVNGSVTPVIFSLSPKNLNNIKWDITKVIFDAIDDSAMDDSKFAGLNALTNGLILRRVNGNTKNIVNIKSNGDFFLKDFETEYTDKSGGGDYGVRAKRTFAGQENTGITLQLDSETDDELQIIVQDNLTGLVSLKAFAIGHVVD